MSNPGDSDYHLRNVILPDELAERVLEWHGGMGTMVYSLGSTGMSDYVSPSMIDAAVEELKGVLARNKDLPKDRRWNRREIKELKDLIGELDAVARFSDEFTSKEAGLGDEEEGYPHSGYATWLMDEDEDVLSFRGAPYSILSYRQGTLYVILSNEASERWGAYLEPGIETKDLGKFRRDLRNELKRIAKSQDAHTVEVFATSPGIEDWLIDTIDVDSGRESNPRCGAGEILINREGYHRRGYDVLPTTYERGGKTIHRRGYHVRATDVSPSSFCIPDPGRPGRRSRGAEAGPFSGEEPWIQHKGKLGGPGYTDRPAKDRRRILQQCVDKEGYRSCLGSLMVLLRNTELRSSTRKKLTADKEWLKANFGGPGSFGSRKSNPRHPKTRRGRSKARRGQRR